VTDKPTLWIVFSELPLTRIKTYLDPDLHTLQQTQINSTRTMERSRTGACQLLCGDTLNSESHQYLISKRIADRGYGSVWEALTVGYEI
jgi:hypothetical protein